MQLCTNIPYTYRNTNRKHSRRKFILTKLDARGPLAVANDPRTNLYFFSSTADTASGTRSTRPANFFRLEIEKCRLITH